MLVVVIHTNVQVEKAKENVPVNDQVITLMNVIHTSILIVILMRNTHMRKTHTRKTHTRKTQMRDIRMKKVYLILNLPLTIKKT